MVDNPIKDTLSQPSTWGGIGHIGMSGLLFTVAHELPPDFTAFNLGSGECKFLLVVGAVMLFIAGGLGVYLQGFGSKARRSIDEKGKDE